MVNHTTTTQPGDTLLLSAGPLQGVRALSNYALRVTGQDAQAWLAAELRVSAHEGLYFSEWAELTPATLLALTSSPEPRTLWLQIRLRHQGAAQLLTFEQLQFFGQYQAPAPRPARQQLSQQLRQILGTPEHEALSAALLRKLHAPGILPAYVQRGETAEEGAGWRALWGTDARFFAALMLLARRLGQQHLLDEFLRQRGLHFAPGTLSRHHAEQLRKTFLHQVAQRGTAAIFEPGQLLGAPAGEFRRLVGAPDQAPLPWALTAPQASGWVVGQTSPLTSDQAHPGLLQNYGGAPFPSLAHLPLGPAPDQVRLAQAAVGPNQADPDAAPGLPQTIVRLTATGPEWIGLRHPAGLAQAELTVAIDPAFDYEVAWLVRHHAPAGSRLRLGVQGFDQQGNRRQLLTPAGTRTEACTPPLRLPAGKWVWISCPVFAAGADPAHLPTHLAQLGVGTPLLNPGRVTRLCPTAELSLDTGPGAPATLDVAMVQVRPLATGAHLTPRRHPGTGRPASAGAELGGYVSPSPWLLAYYRNGNTQLSAAQIATIVRRQLAPAGAELLLIAAQDHLRS